MQQQQNGPSEFKRSADVACWLAMTHQRGLAVVMYEKFGPAALGISTALAFVLMCVWAAFSEDPLMYGWIAIWVMSLIQRRMETAKLVKSGARIHSMQEGSWGASLWLGRSDRAARLVVEPAFLALFGGFLYQVYLAYGLPVCGLPSFVLTGCVSLPFVAMVRQRIWEQRMTAMQDAMVEQESMVQEMRQRFGE